MTVEAFDQRVANQPVVFTQNQQDVLRYIHAHAAQIATMPIAELAAAVHYSNSFVSKLVRKIGYASYAELRFELQGADGTDSVADASVPMALDDLAKTQQMLEQTRFLPICALLDSARAIYLFGTGHSQANAMRELARLLMPLVRVPVIFLTGESEFLAVLPTVTAADCMWLASTSGETPAVLQAMRQLRLKVVPVVSLTIFSDNSLAQLATHRLYYYSTPIANPRGGRALQSLLPLNYCIDYVVRAYAGGGLGDKREKMGSSGD